MLTTALQSKTPLPQDSLSTRFVPTGIVQHDILVLTQRLTKEPGESIKEYQSEKIWNTNFYLYGLPLLLL